MTLGPVSTVHVHGHSIELLERLHGLEQDAHETATFDSLDSTCQQVGRERLEVLQHEHAERVAEYLVRFVVVTVAYVSRGHEQFERIIVVDVEFAALDLLLDLLHALLAMRREAEFFLVAPEHTRSRFHLRLGQHVMQDDHLVARLVAHDHEHRAMLESNAILD